MRAHILLATMALLISACASHRDLSGKTDRSGYNLDNSQQAMSMDTNATAREHDRY